VSIPDRAKLPVIKRTGEGALCLNGYKEWSMRRNGWLTNALLGLAVALLAINSIQMFWHPAPVAAQGGGAHWKVIAIEPTDAGASRIDAELNNPDRIGQAVWTDVSVHMPAAVNGKAIVIFRRAKERSNKNSN